MRFGSFKLYIVPWQYRPSMAFHVRTQSSTYVRKGYFLNPLDSREFALCHEADIYLDSSTRHRHRKKLLCGLWMLGFLILQTTKHWNDKLVLLMSDKNKWNRAFLLYGFVKPNSVPAKGEKATSDIKAVISSPLIVVYSPFRSCTHLRRLLRTKRTCNSRTSMSDLMH